MKKNFIKTTVLLPLLCLIFIFTISNAYASPFAEIDYTFDDYLCNDLDWCDYDDDNNSGSTSLGFSVTIGGDTYDHFDIDSNGYVELLHDEFDSPVEYGYGSIDELLYDVPYTDPSSTYLLAAYDDLSSYYYGYYGYELYADRAVFYYETETYDDEDYEYLNLFEMVLYDNGNVQWNYDYADYDDYGYDLFSGLYFGNTGTLLELVSGEIPEESSYLYTDTPVVPEPISSTLFLVGASVLGFRRFRKQTITN